MKKIINTLILAVSLMACSRHSVPDMDAGTHISCANMANVYSNGDDFITYQSFGGPGTGVSPWKLITSCNGTDSEMLHCFSDPANDRLDPFGTEFRNHSLDCHLIIVKENADGSISVQRQLMISSGCVLGPEEIYQPVPMCGI